jgi:transcriptional regulator with XRE-family HTH domain
MWIKEWRELAGITQIALGHMLGVSGVTVHRWEQRLSRPSWRHMDKIVALTDGSVSATDFTCPISAVETSSASGHHLFGPVEAD